MKKSDIYTIAALAVVRNCIVVGEVDEDDIDVLEELLLQRVDAQAAEFVDNEPCDPVSENVRNVFENIGNLFDREPIIGEAARPADDPGDAVDPFGGTLFPGGADGTDEDGGAV